MNKIIITGRISNDIELKTANSGTELCNFNVAVDRPRKDEDGNKVADFVPCTVFGKSAAFLNQYFKKGDGINVEGRLESRKYVDKEGRNRTAWNVLVERLEFPHGKGKGGQSDSSSAFTEEVDASDGDLPF